MSQLSSFGDNLVIFIQGASRGLGLGFVESLLSNDQVSRLYASSRNPEKSFHLQELLKKYPEKLSCLILDITQEDSIDQAASFVAKGSKKVHLLINCSGILHQEGMMPEKKLADIQPENCLHSFQINTLGPLLMAKHFQPLFRHQERAVFANISARVGSIEDNRLGGWYAYRVSKAAQNMATKNVALEFKRTAKTTICLALHPGTVATDLSKPFQRNVKPEKLFTVEQSVSFLLKVINQREMSDSGKFYAWDGAEIPW